MQKALSFIVPSPHPTKTSNQPGPTSWSCYQLNSPSIYPVFSHCCSQIHSKRLLQSSISVPFSLEASRVISLRCKLNDTTYPRYNQSVNYPWGEILRRAEFIIRPPQMVLASSLLILPLHSNFTKLPTVPQRPNGLTFPRFCKYFVWNSFLPAI